MEEPRFTLTQLVSLSLAMSLFFGFNQAVGFIARILFRVALGPEQYGVFAFLINLFVFFVGMNGFSLNVPIIARISENPTDDSFYRDFSSQILSTTLAFGSIISAIFVLWTISVTNELFLVLYLAAMIVLYSSGQIMHCFPRGRERFRPAAISLVIGGLGRLVLLMLFALTVFNNLSFAILAYTLPFLGWWATYLFYEKAPSPSIPRPRFMLSVYTDSFVSYLYPLGTQIPVVLGIVLLTSFHGFGTAGDFDIALIPYYALAALFTGISFVTISKARKLPSFRQIMKKLVPSVIVPLFVLSALALVTSSLAEVPLKQILAFVGLPSSVYWSIVLLVSVGVPTSILVSLLVSYFQGLGFIRPVGAIVILCSLGSIPLQILLAFYLSIEGVILSVVLINMVIVLLLLLYGYRSGEVSQRLEREEDSG